MNSNHNNHIIPSEDQDLNFKPNGEKKKTSLSFLKTIKGGVSKSKVVFDMKKEKNVDVRKHC